MIAYLNGRFLPEIRCAVPASDSGFLYGDGVYETLRAYGGSVLFLQDHLRRLSVNLTALGIRPRMSTSGFRRALDILLAKNHIENVLIRITVTRGRVLSGSPDFSWGPPTVYITARPFDGYPHRNYMTGVRVATYPWNRGKGPTVKSTSFQAHLLARMYARGKGAFEALLVDDGGYVLEGSMSNIFILQGNRIVTPALRLGILPGVTRSRVMEGARKKGFIVNEGSVPLSSLRTCQGAFLTSTSMECLPIRRVDGRPLRLPKPGLLSDIWKEAVGGSRGSSG